MPQINWIQVSTFLVSEGAPPPNYIPISAIPVDQGDAPFVEAAKLYGSVAAMIDDGFLETDPAVLAAGQVFGQVAFTLTPPTRVVIVHRATPVAQVDEFTVVATDDGDYKLFISLIGGSAVEAATFAAVANTVTEIKDGLIAAFNLGPFAPTQTAADVDADTGSITADVAGVPFVLTATGPNGAADITLETVTASAGIYQDLDAAWLVANFWGVIPDPSEDDGVKYEISRWAEASAALDSIRRNVAFLQTNDADLLTASEPNFASVLVALNRTRSFPLYHVNLTDKMTAAWFGRYGGQFPGSRAWHYAQLGGTTLTDTINYSKAEGDALIASRVSWVERYGQSAQSPLRITWGQGAGAFFVVQKQAEDYWWLRTNQAMSEAMESPSGVNLDEAGLAKLVAAVNVVNAELGTSDPPVIDLDRTTVVAVDLSEIPASQLAIGDYKTPPAGVFVDTVLIPKLRSVGVSGVFATA